MKSGHFYRVNTNDKLKHGFWLFVNLTFIILCGLMTCFMPVIDALENDTNAALALTASGRFQIAYQSFIGILFVSLFPATFSYIFSKMLGIKDEQQAKLSKGLRMALFVWSALVLLGLIGAIAFWLQIHPLQFR